MELLPNEIVWEIVYKIPFLDWYKFSLVSKRFRKLILDHSINKQKLLEQDILESDFLIYKLKLLKATQNLIQICTLSDPKLFVSKEGLEFKKFKVKYLYDQPLILTRSPSYFNESNLIVTPLSIGCGKDIYSIDLESTHNIRYTICDKYIHVFDEYSAMHISIAHIFASGIKKFTLPDLCSEQKRKSIFNARRIIICPNYDFMFIYSPPANPRTEFRTEYSSDTNLFRIFAKSVLEFVLWNGYPFIFRFEKEKFYCEKILSNGGLELAFTFTMSENSNIEQSCNESGFPALYFYKDVCVMFIKKSQQIIMFTKTEFIKKVFQNKDTIEANSLGIQWMDNKHNFHLFTFDVISNRYKYYKTKKSNLGY